MSSFISWAVQAGNAERPVNVGTSFEMLQEQSEDLLSSKAGGCAVPRNLDNASKGRKKTCSAESRKRRKDTRYARNDQRVAYLTCSLPTNVGAMLEAKRHARSEQTNGLYQHAYRVGRRPHSRSGCCSRAYTRACLELLGGESLSRTARNNDVQASRPNSIWGQEHVGGRACTDSHARHG